MLRLSNLLFRYCLVLVSYIRRGMFLFPGLLLRAYVYLTPLCPFLSALSWQIRGIVFGVSNGHLPISDIRLPAAVAVAFSLCINRKLSSTTPPLYRANSDLIISGTIFVHSSKDKRQRVPRVCTCHPSVHPLSSRDPATKPRRTLYIHA